MLHDVGDPATEDVVTTVELVDAGGADVAIARARAVAPSWAAVAPGDRARLLRRFADTVDAHVEELAALEVRNAGHTIGNARWEVGNVRDVLHYFAAAPERLFGRQIAVAGGVDLTFQEPIGVVGVIVPWNFPMPIAGWGFAPALTAGNPVVLKPAELTPLTAVRRGSWRWRPGWRASSRCCPARDRSSGSGSSTTRPSARSSSPGRPRSARPSWPAARSRSSASPWSSAARARTSSSPDADLEQAAATAPSGVFDNAGQDCCARSRILVERSVSERFLELLEPAVLGVRVKAPGEEDALRGRPFSALLASLPGLRGLTG